MIKRADDYIDKLCEKYPTVLRSDIKKIVHYGFRLMFRLVRRGLDIQLQNGDLWFYIGKLSKDSIKHFDYYRTKMQLKLRYIFEQYHKWDGYYYLAVPNDCQFNKRNKIPKLKLKKVTFFKCLDAAKIYYYHAKYFVRVKPIVDLGYKYYREEATIKNAELVYTRENTVKFKDILTDSGNYDIL